MNQQTIPTIEEVDFWLAQKSLAHFTRQAWKVIEPDTKLDWNWHIDLICEYLMASFYGEILDLILNIPPRHMKSTCVSVVYPVWVWIHQPSHKFLTASYVSDLAIRDAVKSRAIIESLWHREWWGHLYKLSSDQNVKSRYTNTRGGHRISTSVGGAAVGEGGDTIILDDPHNLKKIHSEVERNTCAAWWREVMSTRRNDPNESRRIVIGQRGHVGDLFGVLEEQGGYHRVVVPTEAERKTVVLFPRSGKEITREEGELLWKNRFNKKVVEAAKVEMGSRPFSAQYNQSPIDVGGNIFDRDWFKLYKVLPKDCERVIQSWDTAAKDKEQNDFNVCLTGTQNRNGYYITGRFKKRMKFPALKKAAIILHAAEKPKLVLVEDKSSGEALIPSLQDDTKMPVMAIQVDSDKVARANAVSPVCEAGNVYLPEDADWVEDFLKEMEAFDSGPYDDQVDAFTQLMYYFLGFYKNKVATPRLTVL